MPNVISILKQERRRITSALEKIGWAFFSCSSLCSVMFRVYVMVPFEQCCKLLFRDYSFIVKIALMSEKSPFLCALSPVFLNFKLQQMGLM